MRKTKTKSKKGRRGPKPETLALEGLWVDAVGQALAKGKPPKKSLKKKRRPK
jgi:hypothetical protein